ncbi:MAG: hypothetical protein WB420_13320, partial [Bradyrhizobium sp.]
TPRKNPGRMPPGPRKKPGKPQTPRFFITRSVKDWIIQTILAWSRPSIKWEEVREAAKKEYPDGEFNRQTLYGFKNVREAFNETKIRLARERTNAGKLEQPGLRNRPLTRTSSFKPGFSFSKAGLRNSKLIMPG